MKQAAPKMTVSGSVGGGHGARQARLRLVLVLSALAVFLMSLRPMPASLMAVFHESDKLQHVSVFLGLAWIGIAAWPKRIGLVVATLLAYGLGIELAQSATAGRVADIRDWAADFVGVAGALLAWRCAAVLKALKRARST